MADAQAQRLEPCDYCDVSHTHSLVKAGLDCVYPEERVGQVVHPREVEGRLGATELDCCAVVRAAQDTNVTEVSQLEERSYGLDQLLLRCLEGELKLT